MMHITSGASGYFENMWLWVADHMIEYVLLGLAPPLYQSRHFTNLQSLSDPLLDDAKNNMVRMHTILWVNYVFI